MAQNAPHVEPFDAERARLFCKQCGYLLAGLESGKCPECGRGFDLGDRRTFARRPPRGWVWRWGRRVLELVLLLALAAGTGVGWLWWGWHTEQATIAQLRILHQRFTVAPAGPQRLRWILGTRWGYLVERVDYVSLKHLKAADTDALALGSLLQIKELTLQDCQVSQSTLDHLTGLQKLQTLRLYLVETEKPDLAFLEKLSALSEFVLLPEAPARANLEHVGRLKHLKCLTLIDAGLTDDDLKQLQGLSSLEELWLRANHITDAGLEHLQGLKSLIRLRVDRRLVYSAGMAKLRQAIPGLQVTGE